jgi:hypothetical protein
MTSYLLMFSYYYYPNEVQSRFDLIIASHLVFAIMKHEVLQESSTLYKHFLGIYST